MAAWWRRQEGMVTVLVALAITAIMGLSAISLDAGQLYLARGRLQDVGDAAALAGAALLPENPDQAREVALSYAAMNGVPEGRAEARVEEGGDVLQVTVQGHVDTGFGRVVGMPGKDLAVESTARVGALSRLQGAQPLGVEAAGFVYGELYTLRLDSGGGGEPQHGNFNALALGGQGASAYRENLRCGFQGWLSLGDEVETEPGNMEGPTRQGLQDRMEADPDATYQTVESDSPRLLMTPIVESFDVAGRKWVEIIGFAAFFLESIEGGEGLGVQGRFLHLIVDGPSEGFPQAPDCGLRSVKLL